MRADVLSWRIFGRAGALCLTAGFADAVSYTTLGGIFAANMTGNSVLIVIAASRGDDARVLASILTLGAFLAGACLAAVLRRLTQRPLAALLGAAALLVAATFVPAATLARLGLVASAMGLQGAAITRFGSIGMQTVVVTATMIRLADNLVEHLMPARLEPIWGATRLEALAWSSYCLGAVLALLAMRAVARPLLLPAVVLVAVAVEVTAAERPHV